MVSYISLASVAVLTLTLTVAVGVAVDQPEMGAEVEGSGYVHAENTSHVVDGNATLESPNPQREWAKRMLFDTLPEV